MAWCGSGAGPDPGDDALGPFRLPLSLPGEERNGILPLTKGLGAEAMSHAATHAPPPPAA